MARLKGRILARVHADELGSATGASGHWQVTAPLQFPDQMWVEDPSTKLYEDSQ